MSVPVVRPAAAAGGADDPLAPDFDVERDLGSFFGLVAQRHSQRPALRTARRELSHAELLAQADTIALALAAHRAPGAPRRVALLLEDRGRQVLGLLGALRAGCAFVPLDAAHPRERLAECVADSRPAVLLAERATQRLAETLGAPALLLIEDVEPADGAPPDAAPAAPSDAAYILYTSGSTGRPKGVIQTHRNVLHNVHKYARSVELSPDDRHTLLGAYSFAATMTDLFPALSCGAALLPFDVRRHGPAGLAAWLARERPTLVDAVPTLFRHLAEEAGSRRFPSIRVLKLGGEPVLRRDHASFARLCERPARLLNAYGATEMNTIRHLFLDHDARLDGEIVPVGHALPGTDVVLLDERGEPVPEGAEGEIHVTSRYLSPGYWELPDETRRSFRPDPAGDGLRRLATGDLGRMLPGGCLLHLGRRDGQVRVRGHRVEVAEIEAALLAQPRVAQAAVVARRDAHGETQLVAHVVARGGRPPAAAELRTALAARLPAYMLPAAIALRASLPLLAAGKVDRQALAAQDVSATGAGGEPPRDELERTLAALWQRLLHVPAVGRDDDFFELGGHSLLAARLVARLHETLGLAVPLTAVAEAPTVARLAERLRHASRDGGRVLTLQPDGDGTPVFALPGAGSDVFALRDLARRLRPSHALHGLQVRGLDGSEPPLGSVDAMADDLLPHVLAAAPDGPLVLLGSSFGGLVALELARRLRAAGREPELLVLVDTHAPGFPRVRPGLSPAARLRLLARRALPLGDRERFSRPALRRGLRQLGERARFRLARAARRDAPRPFAQRHAFVREACLAAQARHRPADWDGPVLLLAAEEPPDPRLFELAPRLGWEGRLRGALVERTIPGNHATVLHEPHVAALADELLAALQPVRAPRGVAGAKAGA